MFLFLAFAENCVADLTQTLAKGSQKEDKPIDTADVKEAIDKESSFPCEECELMFPKKQARAFDLKRTHSKLHTRNSETEV